MKALPSNVISETPVVFFNGKNSDSFTSAWLLRAAFPAATFVAVAAGDALPEVVEETVLDVTETGAREVYDWLSSFAGLDIMELETWAWTSVDKEIPSIVAHAQYAEMQSLEFDFGVWDSIAKIA